MAKEASKATPCKERRENPPQASKVAPRGDKAAVWTGDMTDVARLCGDDVAWELCDKLPGISFYVPKKVRDRGPLGRLDDGPADLLVRHFGGATIYIPSRRKTYHDTFAAIEALVDKGWSTREIAVHLGITQSYVFRVRRKAGAQKIASKPDPRQLLLFR